MEDNINVAIVGLGRVGTTFLKKLYDYKERGISIIGVTETNADSPGLNFARQKGITILSDKDDIIALGSDVNVVFNLTGDQTIERGLRLAHIKAGNHKTVVVSTAMASLMWKLISKEALPEHAKIVSI